MMGETKLLIRNKVKIFLIRSFSSGLLQSNKNKEKGRRVVFRKKDMTFLIRMMLIFPVRVYRCSQCVIFSTEVSRTRLIA
jgi:hypothetical protein